MTKTYQKNLKNSDVGRVAFSPFSNYQNIHSNPDNFNKIDLKI